MQRGLKLVSQGAVVSTQRVCMGFVL